MHFDESPIVILYRDDIYPLICVILLGLGCNNFN